jgi:Uma2 family endonuclease
MTVTEFEQLEDSLGDERVELIDGQVIERGDRKPSHVLAMELTKGAIQPMLPGDRFIREDKPVKIPDFNEPFPDLAVAHGSPRTYADHHPGPEDVSLLIEVSDTTLSKDRGVKLDTYARSGVAVYWIVNLVDRQVEVYSGPGTDGYANRDDYRPGQHVPVVVDGTIVGQIAVDDILP